MYPLVFHDLFLNYHTLCSPIHGKAKKIFFLLGDARSCYFIMTGSISLITLYPGGEKHLGVAGINPG